ncbi:MAG TPA: GAF domain-containing protein [Anaerolineales bacterium]|nr:GAF domain-containing protein [Anaerolineales bacterium]
MKEGKSFAFLNVGETGLNQPVYQKWREGLMRPILNIALIIGFVALITGVLTDNSITETALYIGVYFIIVLVAAIRMPYWLRAAIILGAAYLWAITELLSYGVLGDGIFIFLGLITIATMFFATRGGLTALAVSLTSFAAIGWLSLSGLFTLLDPAAVPAQWSDWVSNSLSLALFSGIIIVGFRQLDIEYMKAQGRTAQSARELENQRRALEDRVAERTLQFKAVNEVGRVASSVLDPNELINKVVNLITDQFGYYYTALFLVDSSTRWAELRNATGEAGRVLRENKHRLEIGGKSMVGAAISTRSPRVALDVGAETTRFKNPLLPYTRSEIALPLLVGDRVLGALDVQSTKEGAFGPQEIDTLQNMASQVSIALENAELFHQVQQNLAEIQAVQKQYTTQSWKQVADGEDLYYEVGDTDPSGPENELEVNLALRDEVIGGIRLESDNDWTSEQRNLIESVATQAALALENARLVKEGQTTATRERLISEISGKIWSSATMDGILRTAVQELGRALDVADATIELNMDDKP